MSLVSVDIFLAAWCLCIPQKRELCAGQSDIVPMVLFRSRQFDFSLQKIEQAQIYLFLNNMLVMDCKSQLFALIGVFIP